MAGDEAKRVITDMIEQVWREGRLDRLSDFWSDDCINHADLSVGNQGLVALRAYHEQMMQHFSALTETDIIVERQVAEADLVVTQILA